MKWQSADMIQGSVRGLERSSRSRLLLTPQAKVEQVLNEATQFDCVRGGETIGKMRTIESMPDKPGARSTSAGGSLKRLQCAPIAVCPT